jgi:hypothetical protein
MLSPGMIDKQDWQTKTAFGGYAAPPLRCGQMV